MYAVRDTKAITTIRKVDEFVQRFGAPNRFITDRGTSFTADSFKQFCDTHGIKLTFNSSRHAQANGQIERLNQTILPALQSSLTDTESRHWDENVLKLERDLNTVVCKTTGRTPFEALFGYVPRFNEGLSRVLSERSETYCPPEDIRAEMRDKIEHEKELWKERYDRTRLTNVTFNEGDIVVVRTSKVASGESTKLQARYKGPLVITKVFPSDTYRVQSLAAKGDSKHATTAHVSQIKIWRGLNSDEESSDDETEVNESEQLVATDDRIVKNIVSDEPNIRRKRTVRKPQRLIEE